MDSSHQSAWTQGSYADDTYSPEHVDASWKNFRADGGLFLSAGTVTLGPASPEMRLSLLASHTGPVPADERVVIAGVAVPLGTVIEVPGAIPQLFQPGAFLASLNADDPAVIVAFDSGKVLGRRSSGTARFSEARSGLGHVLRYECSMPGTSFASDALVSIERGDFAGVAASVVPLVSHLEAMANYPRVRVVDAAQLVAVHLVPNYLATNGSNVSISKQQPAADMWAGLDFSKGPIQ